ncbi:hypothetical protein [Paenibacillus qinlingensis]|uniref:Pyruvate/2-oxoacid:ferredoxin oxidoreductase beta subunit n=1 Tax=Paenibacillus qinlingensis TaxID=1837343 RepID=A0ABU1NPB7_9BACL|nr:hypothetical protein [Paenibacillus qinlingensis]MDR6549326.1 pyruvate/2-oxoacid:ferredoxin oxidoreductase beta subunit [Paenibacillus qinlingensis]
MLIRRIGKGITLAILIITLTACSLFGGGAKKKEEEKKEAEAKSKESVIDQELKKQYQMYNEVIEYQKAQDVKLIKESEERYKKLKEQADKPTKGSGEEKQKAKEAKKEQDGSDDSGSTNDDSQGSDESGGSGDSGGSEEE